MGANLVPSLPLSSPLTYPQLKFLFALLLELQSLRLLHDPAVLRLDHGFPFIIALELLRGRHAFMKHQTHAQVKATVGVAPVSPQLTPGGGISLPKDCICALIGQVQHNR